MRYWKSCYGRFCYMFQGREIIVFYPKDGVSARCKNCKWRLKRGQYPCHRDRWETLTMPKTMRQTHVQWCGASWKISSQQDCHSHQLTLWTLAVWCPQVVYCVPTSAIGEDRPNHKGRKSQLYRANRKLWEIISWQLSMPKQIGLPVGNWSVPQTRTMFLLNFFKTRVYDKKRSFKVTTSPSMDILVSSNLERLIFHLVGNDATKTKKLMESLVATGSQYQLLATLIADILDLFGGCIRRWSRNTAEINGSIRS